jgi:hypothetical protein
MFLFFSNTCNYSKKKHLGFSKLVTVIFIPNRKQIIEANLMDELWWCEKDYTRFQIDSFNEMRELKSKHPTITRRQILKLLYQPGNISYDKRNFE